VRWGRKGREKVTLSLYFTFRDQREVEEEMGSGENPGNFLKKKEHANGVDHFSRR